MDKGAECYRRFLNGDDNGLAEIIDMYNEGLSLYLNGIMNNICEAEEIMQETFVKLAVKKPKFDGKCAFKTWLYTIARNCALNYKRYRSRFSDAPIDENFCLSDETDIERQYLLEEQKIELHKAMKNLKPEYFQVLYLKYFENFDIENIAKVMHKSKRQIENLTYRAKKSLKSELEKAGFHYEEF